MINLIDLILCGATFLLTFLIFINPNKVNTKANWWFGAFVFCIFLILFENLLITTKTFKEDDLILELIGLSNFVIAPIFFLSVSYYIEPVKKWKITDYLHFGFALLILALILLSHLITEKVNPKDVNPQTIAYATLIFNICFSLQVIPYCILAYVKIIRHQRNIRQLNSTVENIDLKWLKNIIISVVVIAVFWVFDIVFSLSEKNPAFDYASSLIYLLGILYIMFHWLKQEEIFPYGLAEKEAIETIIIETEETQKERKKLLPDEKVALLKAELLELMDSGKPYLDYDLNLFKLAALLNISTHHLSYVINSSFNENFYQFVNRCRIEQAKKMILDPKWNHLSLLGIGFEVGFNSKTVFNTSFKRITGQTPSEFKKQNTQQTGTGL